MLLHLALIAFMSAQGADLASSEYAFGRGGFHEANPILRPLQDKPLAFGVAKMGLASGLAWSALSQQKTHAKAITVLTLIGAGGYTAIAIHNARLLQPARR